MPSSYLHYGITYVILKANVRGDDRGACGMMPPFLRMTTMGQMTLSRARELEAECRWQLIQARRNGLTSWGNAFASRLISLVALVARKTVEARKQRGLVENLVKGV